MLAIGLIALAPFPGSPRPSPQTHFYQVEYKKPMKGLESVATLDVVFYTKVSTKQAEDFLRSELAFVVGSLEPKTDILASAWYSKNGEDADEEQMDMTDGSSNLFFWKERSKTVLWKEYQAEKAKAPAGAKTLDVVVDAKVVSKGSGSVVVEGTTNLPDGMSLWIELRCEKTGFWNQAVATVKNGRFVSEPIGENKRSKKKLEKGDYSLEVSMPGPHTQTPEVQRVIGQQGELLSGKLIGLGNYGKTLDFKKAVQIP
jgi:hypothetical protein